MGLFARDGSALFAAGDLAALRIAIAVVGIVGSLLPALLFAHAQTRLPSALAGMLNALSPLWTLVISVVVFRNKVHRDQTLGLFIGFIGAVGLVAFEGLGRAHFEWSEAVPALMLVAATLGYGISVNTVRERLAHLRSYVISAISLGLVALPAWAWVASSDLPEVVAVHPDGPRGLLAIVVLASVGTAGALVLFNTLIQWTNALVAASVTYIIPVFATLWGFWDGEVLHSGQILAGVIILAGVWVTNRKKR
jgi:drug/metabolite transporter (DMT)-like permease